MYSALPETESLSASPPLPLDAMPEATNRNFTSRDELSAAHIAEPSQSRVRPTPAIGDYALIGDGHTAALVSQQGSIDWLCLPHFSAPSIFGALLDNEQGGRFVICPQAACRAQRRYLDSTNVLQTTFTTSDGVIRLTDMMTIAPADGTLRPMREVLRIIEGMEGDVEVNIEIDPRPDYGRIRPRAEFRESLGWTWSWGNELLWLTSDLKGISASGNSPGMSGVHRIRAGDRRFLSLGYVKGDIAVIAPLGSAATGRRQATIEWWRDWVNQSRYEGPYGDAVRRSALTLKMLTHAISGAVVAAPTTSLPETIGGDRNWDYRYCWLRDAALTMRAFTGLGYLDEARRFLDWLLHTTRLTWPELQIVYDIYGRPELPEFELAHWRGHRESRPVRIGNAAQNQLQLDVYGNVLFAARNFAEAGGELRAAEARLLRGLGQTVCRLWRKPDNSMWEIRGERRQYTFSKIMCWTALDCLIKLQTEGIIALRVADLERERNAIYGEIESRGFNAKLGSYVGVFGGESADASLLLAGCLGYRDPSHPRMRSSYDFLHQRLTRNGLMYRYEAGYDSLTLKEGAFGICSFWAIDYLARRGDFDVAHRSFEHLLMFANDVGLYAEEIDPEDGTALGNSPQAFTHIGLINAALTLAASHEERRSSE